MDRYNEELYGKILWESSRSLFYTVGLSLLHVLFCVAFVLILLEHPGILSYAAGFAIFLLTLWRIHWIHKSVVLACEKKILVTLPFGYSEFELKNLVCPKYMAFDYEEIVGVSDDWNYLFLGERIAGGIVEVPVQLKYMTSANKRKLQELVERKHREA